MRKALLLCCLVMTQLPGMANEVRLSRYTTQNTTPSVEQINPFAETINTRFPSSIDTIGKALSVLVAPTGYQIVQQEHNAFMENRLSLTQRSFVNVSRYRAIMTLLPDVYVPVTDPVTMKVAFDVRPEFSSYASTSNQTILENANDVGGISADIADSELSALSASDGVSETANMVTVANVSSGTNVSLNAQLSDASVKIETPVIDNNEYTFTFKKGFLIKDNIRRFAKTIGYREIVFNAFPSECDWNVPYDYEIHYSNNESRDVLYEMLSRKGFDDIRFWELNKTVTATYKGSSSFIKSCLSRRAN